MAQDETQIGKGKATVTPERRARQGLRILLPMCLLYFVSVSYPMDLKEAYKPKRINHGHTVPARPSTDNKEPAFQRSDVQLVLAEHKKCVDEIRGRLQDEERWFDLKFTFIGIITFGFFAHTIFKEYDEGRKQRRNPQTGLYDPDVAANERPFGSGFATSALKYVMQSQVAVFVIGLATTISIIADMHIRSNRCIIAQNGLWIAYFAEPELLGVKYDDAYRGQFVGWEQFLRINGKDLPAGGSWTNPLLNWIDRVDGGAGYHADAIYSMLWWPHMFLVTVMMYGAFLMLIQWQGRVRKQALEEQDKRDRINLTKAIFIVVHAFILICAISTQCVPATFSVLLLGFATPRIVVMTIYGIVGLILWVVADRLIYREFESTCHP